MSLVIHILIILGVAWIIAKIANSILYKCAGSNIHIRWLSTFLRTLVYIFGVFTAMKQIPAMEQTLNTILAGSGILALTVGLAAQESLGNFISGLVIIIFKPFKVGDRVHITSNNMIGIVEDITLRHTVIKTFVNSRIVIPNSVMNKEILENSNFNTEFASSFLDIIVVHGSDLQLAIDSIQQIIVQHKETIDINATAGAKSPPDIFVRNLGLSGVELRVSIWTKDVSTNFRVCSEIRTKIYNVFKIQNIKLAEYLIFNNKN